jgi:nitroreductase
MIAVTTMMLAAEAYGLDTAPMEGFDAAGVKREFGIPEGGRGRVPARHRARRRADKPYTGRFPVARIAFAEKFGEAWGAGERQQ